MENFGYLFAGYSLFWLIIFAYVVSIARRQKSVENELAALLDREES